MTREEAIQEILMSYDISQDTKDAAIEALKFRGAYEIAVKAANKAFENRWTQWVEWIPCSERYPEENQICIVTDETMRNTYEYHFCKDTYDENQGWTYLNHRIIAWMPLPEPYQEDNQ